MCIYSDESYILNILSAICAQASLLAPGNHDQKEVVTASHLPTLWPHLALAVACLSALDLA